MSKVMVVEDDANLREIYSIRITAEGYEVVSAGDGEEALAVAVREKPDLILSDVMMPKISGFDMLDILRSTPETANIKVIMMTALSADDQRQRGERLGANRYLVKSQVGIEDVVNAIHEVLGDRSSSVSTQANPTPATQAQPASNIPADSTTAPVTPPTTVAVPSPVAAPNPVTSEAPSLEPTQPVAAPTQNQGLTDATQSLPTQSADAPAILNTETENVAAVPENPAQ